LPQYDRSMGETTRYDGLADWYDEEFQPAPLEGDAWQVVAPLIGEGSGELLDLGCGTGAYAGALAGLGWTVTGVDVSEDMLRRARRRGVHVVRSDAVDLPFEDGSFDAAVSIFTHSDFDDFPAALREVARVLVPGAPFVYLGVHPCFVGPHSLYVQARGVPRLHEGWYRREGHYIEAPGISPEGLRARFGATHIPLGRFLQGFLDAGFRFEHIEEPEGRDYPYMLALKLRR
jgi:SAM-dependent methyltransferase